MFNRLVCTFDLHYESCQMKEECTKYQPCGKELFTDNQGKLACPDHGEDI